MNAERAARAQWAPPAFLVLIGLAVGLDALPRWLSGLLLIGALVFGAVAGTCRTIDMLALLAMSVPLQDVGNGEFFGASVTLTKLCLLCLAIGWTCRVAAGGRVPIDSVVWAYAAVAMALGASIIAGSGVLAWAGELYRWLAAAFVFLVAKSEIRERAHVDRMILGISVGVFGVSVHAIRQVMTSDGPPPFVVNGLLRAYGTFGQPNPLAAYLELSLPIVIAITILPVANRRRPALPPFSLLISTIAIAGGIVSLVLTQSRGGWLGFGAAGVVLLLGFPPRARAGVAGGIAAAVAGGLVIGPGGDLADRLLSSFDGGGSRVHVTAENWSNEERRAHWRAALDMARASPWTGVGAGGFDNAYREYTSDWRFRVSRGHAHNGYLQMAAQAGWSGLVSFTCWVGVIAFKTTKSWRVEGICRADGRALGGVATVVAFGIHSMVDYLNVLSIGIQLALALAIALAGLPSKTGMMTEGTDTP